MNGNNQIRNWSNYTMIYLYIKEYLKITRKNSFKFKKKLTNLEIKNMLK